MDLKTLESLLSTRGDGAIGAIFVLVDALNLKLIKSEADYWTVSEPFRELFDITSVLYHACSSGLDRFFEFNFGHSILAVRNAIWLLEKLGYAELWDAMSQFYALIESELGLVGVTLSEILVSPDRNVFIDVEGRLLESGFLMRNSALIHRLDGPFFADWRRLPDEVLIWASGHFEAIARVVVD